MRHRMGMADQTGIGGNSSPVILDNQGELTEIQEDMIRDAMKLWKKLEDGIDYQLHENAITFGYEPSYEYEDLLIINISKDKGESYVRAGHAFGSWGTDIVSKSKTYKAYKKKGKFVKFVDKWHGKLFK